MDKFDNYINTVLKQSIFKESILDISRDSLDVTVFQFFEDGRPPILHDGIKKQILTDVSKIDEMVPVEKFFMIGSILTNNYTEDSDIDVNVQIDAQDSDTISSEAVLDLINHLNGKLAIGTTHAVNYFVVTSEYDLDKTEAAYDIVNERWIKQPEYINPDVQTYIIKFQNTLHNADILTGELRRSLVDIDELRRLNKKDAQYLRMALQKKLEAVDENVKQLFSMYHDVALLRRIAFDRNLTPEEIRMFGSKNRLPENIVYKLLEKYYYIQFIRDVKAILGEEDEEVNLNNISAIKQAGKKIWK